MTIYYLYVKTHNITGLKYLGYTSRKNPHKYTGSGTRWSNHLNVHGFDFTTEIIKECTSKLEIREHGIYYSRLWNVVDDKNWANLKEEQGDGGGCFGEVNGMFGKTHSPEVKVAQGIRAVEQFKGKSYEELYGLEKAVKLKKIRSEKMKGRNNAGTSNPMYGKKQKESSKEIQSFRAKNRTKHECPHCKKLFTPSPLSRYHGDRCKMKHDPNL